MVKKSLLGQGLQQAWKRPVELNGHDNILLGLVGFVLMIGHIAQNAVLNENLAGLNFLSELALTQLVSF